MSQPLLLAALIGGAVLGSSASAASMAANIPSIFQLSGKIYVGVSNVQWDGTPSTCSPATPMYLVDPNTAVGRAQLSLVLTAKEANHRVYLIGDGVCVGGGPIGIQAESLIGIQLQ